MACPIVATTDANGLVIGDNIMATYGIAANQITANDQAIMGQMNTNTGLSYGLSLTTVGWVIGGVVIALVIATIVMYTIVFGSKSLTTGVTGRYGRAPTTTEVPTFLNNNNNKAAPPSKNDNNTWTKK